MSWEELNPPYRTIVADPPWPYDAKRHGNGAPSLRRPDPRPQPLGYSTMAVPKIVDIPVEPVAARAAHCYLWTTQRYVEAAFGVMGAWGFRYCELLTWCKTPNTKLGGTYIHTTEFCLFGKRGMLPHKERVETTWFTWPRGPHSVKPAAFYDMVERVSPGPYLELFARQPRLGWDSWGWGYEEAKP